MLLYFNADIPVIMQFLLYSGPINEGVTFFRQVYFVSFS